MGWTKRDLIIEAYTEIGMANYVFDLEPEQFQTACRKMDTMVASWPDINIGYASSDSPSTADINVDSGVPAYANAAIYLNRALALAPTVGKTPSAITVMSAKKAYLEMLKAAMPKTIEYQMPSTLPRGAGQKPWRSNGSPFMDAPTDPLETGPDGELDLIN